MSTFEAKVEVTRDFLKRRAEIGRTTTFQELGAVVGQRLYELGQRSIAIPVRREKIADVLKAIDDESLAKDGVMLSVLVVHLLDNGIGHRFYEWAVERGLLDEDATEEMREEFHSQQFFKVKAMGQVWFSERQEFEALTRQHEAEEFDESVDLA